MSSLSIITYEDRFQPMFKSLNLEWLEQFNLLEERDLVALNNPRKTILEEGGIIYLAVVEDLVVGSAAVICEHGEYELAKMAVDKAYRGKGISKLLLDQCLAFAKAKGASRIMLYSNSQLTSALALYKRYGFKEIILQNSPFQTADIKMELKLV
ncbi:MAG TPA: GNAT family N-acetyltransferase [Chryseosolibacter sp.]